MPPITGEERERPRDKPVASDSVSCRFVARNVTFPWASQGHFPTSSAVSLENRTPRLFRRYRNQFVGNGLNLCGCDRLPFFGETDQERQIRQAIDLARNAVR